MRILKSAISASLTGVWLFNAVTLRAQQSIQVPIPAAAAGQAAKSKVDLVFTPRETKQVTAVTVQLVSTVEEEAKPVFFQEGWRCN